MCLPTTAKAQGRSAKVEERTNGFWKRIINGTGIDDCLVVAASAQVLEHIAYARDQVRQTIAPAIEL